MKIRAIGRLDLETSGIVVFAKNQAAAARLWQPEEWKGRSTGLWRKAIWRRREGGLSCPWGKKRGP